MNRAIALSDEQLMQKLEMIVGTGNAVRFKAQEDVQDSFGNGGRLVVEPQREAEIIEILKLAHAHSLSVIPEGGGSKRGFGGVIEEADILLSLKNLKGITEHSAGDMVMTVKPGTTLQEVQQELAKQGQFLPLESPFPEMSTVGGIISSNTSGPKRLRYGSSRDLVIGLRVIYPDGKVIKSGAKVVKNVAGYDMNKLYIGAMGTLGVITEINFKLKPMPTCQSLMLIESPKDIQFLADFSKKLLDSLMEPVALEIINPSLHVKLNGSASYVLAIGFEDVEKAVEAQEQWVYEQVDGAKEVKTLRNDQAASWWQRFYQAPTMPRHLKIGSKMTEVATILQEIETFAETYDLHVFSHGGTGLGLSHVYIEEESKSDFLAFVKAVQNFMADREGYVIVDKAPLPIRKEISVWGTEQPYFRLMQGIKHKIDPRNVLNPGRFVGGI